MRRMVKCGRIKLPPPDGWASNLRGLEHPSSLPNEWAFNLSPEPEINLCLGI